MTGKLNVLYKPTSGIPTKILMTHQPTNQPKKKFSCENGLCVYLRKSKNGSWTLRIHVTLREDSLKLALNWDFSGPPTAKGHHAEPHTYRTHAFIFVWSAVNVSRARTYARRRRPRPQHRTTWCPYWSTYALHTSMQFDIVLEIHIMVNWQLSNQGICWPVPHDHIAGSGWNSLR